MKKTVRITLFALTFLLITVTGLIQHANALTWSPETQLTLSADGEWSPAITQTKDGKFWVFWHRRPLTGNADIYYKTYNGATWSQDTQFTADSREDINPAALVTSDGTIWVFWTSDRTYPGNYEIFYRTSSDNGVSWSIDNQLTAYPSPDRRPSVMQASDGYIWVVWYSNRLENGGNDDIYYNYFDGTWWYLDTQFTSNAARDIEPTITQSHDGRIWIFWSSNRLGDFEVFYKTSSDNGATWSPDTRLTSASGSDDGVPSAITTQNGQTWIAWSADRKGSNRDIFYRTYNGSTWSSENNLVSDSSIDDLPCLFQLANTTVCVAWQTDRNGDFDIYYESTITDHDVAVTSIEPFSTRAYQGYNTKIKVNVRNDGRYSETFTVTAYYNSIAIGTQTVTGLAPKATTTLTFNWNTIGVLYGYYTLSATASQVPNEEDLTDNTLVGDTVMMTIPGDANGDKTVNIMDMAVISAHWSSGPDGPFGSLGYDAKFDINGDGLIDIVDAGILSLHWEMSW